MEEHVWLKDALVFLIVTGVAIPLFLRLRLGSVLGFIIAGTIVGPYGLGRLIADWPFVGFVVVSDPEAVEPFAEFGIIFLLFVLGLELSFSRLWALRRYVLGLGTVQVAGSTALIGLFCVLLGQSGSAALVVGLALALSSTAIVMQLLVDERRLASPTGQMSLSVLLMQDVMVVPVLIVVGLLAGDAVSIWREIGLALVSAAAAVAVILVLGRYVLRPLLRQAAFTGSRELIMAIVLAGVVAASLGTETAGLSPELGAFLAGLLLSESEYRHQIEVDIEPFKGLLLGLFFISVGMGIDLTLLYGWFLPIVAAAVALVAVKALVIVLSALAFRVPLSNAAETALLLAQAGEFGFVVFAIARGEGILPPEVAQFAVIVISVTMAATPVLARLARRLALRLERVEHRRHQIASGEIDLEDHVVIGGFGRVGRAIARVLEAENVPFVAFDRNARLVDEQHGTGRLVFYGDAGRQEILERAGADRARAFIVTVDSPETAERMVRAVRRCQPDAAVYARARDAEHARALARLGASVVVPEAVEGSLRLAGRILAGLGWPEEAIARRIEQERDRETVLVETGEE